MWPAKIHYSLKNFQILMINSVNAKECPSANTRGCLRSRIGGSQREKKGGNYGPVKGSKVPRARSGENFPRNEGCQNVEISGDFCGLPPGVRSEPTC